MSYRQPAETIISLLHPAGQFLRRSEFYHPSGGNGDFLAGLWISAYLLSSFGDPKGTKSRDGHFFTIFHGFRHVG